MSLTVLIFFSVTVVASVLFFSYQFLGQGYSDDATEVLFDVMPGQSMAAVSKNLEAQKLVKNAQFFQLYAKYTGQNPKLKMGEYALQAKMTPQEILAVITSGKSVTKSLTFPEGVNIFDVADIISRNGFGTREEILALLRDKEFIKILMGKDLESLEGYLFPETYKFTKFESAKTIITQMVNRFQATWSDLEIDLKLFQQNYPQRMWNQNQIVTFASIVEKETGAVHERNLVSSVFHNRLDLRMRLQTDPTVLYGVALKNNAMPNNITRADLKNPTRHNTYTMNGLPPTPIANPGREALKAALNPAKTKYLYFVSQNDGTHRFSDSLVAHNAAVKVFQLNPKARQGKSWRDLNKKQELNK